MFYIYRGSQHFKLLLWRGLPRWLWPVSPPCHSCLGRAAADGRQ